MPPRTDVIPYYQASTTNVKKTSNQYRIRSMVQTDIPVVHAIDQATFNGGAWDLEYFFDYFNDSLCKCWILESTASDYSILGYGFQRFVDGISHIANFCIHPDHRSHGFGGILLRHMIDYGCRLGVSLVELEVNTSNMHAYKLYDKHGFRITRLLQQYYSDTEDAYQMQLIMNRIN